MPTSPVNRVINHLRRAALLQDGAGQTDAQLLALFIRDRDDTAFEALVRRHGPMVMSVCHRHLHNHHDAEDAFQATFLVLAHKAAAIAPPDMLANWLYGVARRTALKARAWSAKRTAREKQVIILPEPEQPAHDPWRELQPLLDQELSRLPEKYQTALVLCDLEGCSIKQAARQLGCPQGTVAGQLVRGRKLLAKRLAQRGVLLPAGALAGILSENAESACVPKALVVSTVNAVGAVAAVPAVAAGVISSNVAALTEGVVMSMLLNKLKAVTMVLVMLGMVAFGGVLVTRATAKAEQDHDENSNAKPPMPAASPAPNIPAEPERTELSFMMKTKLVEVGSDGKSHILTNPQICALEDQLALIDINYDEASNHANIADACKRLKLGTRFEIKVKRAEVGKAQIDLSLSTFKVKKAEKTDTVIVANSVRAVKQVDLGKRARIVLAHDHQGKPQLWFELTVSEWKPDQSRIPVRPENAVDAPAYTAEAAPKKRTPEHPGASWPFIE